MKRLLSLLAVAAVVVTFTSCSSGYGKSVSVINAGNNAGSVFSYTTTTAVTPLQIPDNKAAATTVSSDNGEAVTETELSKSTAVPVLSTYEHDVPASDTHEQQTTVPITTTKEATTTVTTATTVTSSTTTTPASSTTKETTTEPAVTTQEPYHAEVNDYTALNYDEIEGVWISYIELSGVLTGQSETDFRRNFAKMMDNCSGMGINTVFVHMRPFGDAIYRSDLYPWSAYVTGTTAQSSSFDPLEVMIEEAHKKNISIHAWINPLRLMTSGDISLVPTSYKVGSWYTDSSKRGSYIVKVGSYWWLNPAYDEVIELISDGAAELAARYDIDGVHMDDYFYPTTDASFDSSAFASSGSTSLSKWRLANCSRLVASMYSKVKSSNSSVLFGIAPQGSVQNNYNQMYADVEKWCSTSGYIDYVAPQLYYGFNNTAQPYKECIDKWEKLVKGSSVKLIAGLALYKIGSEDTWAGAGKYEWQSYGDIVKRQLEYARKKSGYSGVILYSYNYIFSPSSVTDAIRTELDALNEIL